MQLQRNCLDHELCLSFITLLQAFAFCLGLYFAAPENRRNVLRSMPLIVQYSKSPLYCRLLCRLLASLYFILSILTLIQFIVINTIFVIIKLHLLLLQVLLERLCVRSLARAFSFPQGGFLCLTFLSSLKPAFLQHGAYSTHSIFLL